ncbi:hypothetical protein ACCC92_03190 [Mucilaginibacter sp. Mucisp84]|uniref:hypothetical protein n=1 Tax=Mucilaginibacter sp. Mucisp84 TaxID=3243058 RepID=UPI0039A6A8BD
MSYRIIMLFAFVLIGSVAEAQDYFSDRNNSGTPIFFSQNDKKKYMFSAGVNTSDATAIKVNFYRQYWDSASPGAPGKDGIVYTSTTGTGWGLSANASTKGGVGKLFKSGNFDPGFGLGAYYAITNVTTWKNPATSFHSSYYAWIFSGNLSFANNQLYNPSAAFADQLSTKKLTSPSLAISYVNAPSLAHDDIFWGGSITWKKTSNFDDLDSYTVTDDSLIVANGVQRKVTKVNPNGDTYAVGDYKEYSNFELRGNISYIPAVLDYRFGIIFYPSVDVGGPYSARYNAGIAFNYLQDNNPTISIFTINMELNDISNAAGSSKTFLKRAFKIGISTNLNFITGRQ